MNKIVTIAGYMLTQALDTLERRGFFNPFYSGFIDDNSKIKTFTCKDLALELSIPKIIKKFETNSENVRCAAIAYPAETEDCYNNRESVIIVHVKNYVTEEFLLISQPYRKDKNLEIFEYELFDYSPQLIEKLPEIERSFIQGALKYDDLGHSIWSKKI